MSLREFTKYTILALGLLAFTSGTLHAAAQETPAQDPSLFPPMATAKINEYDISNTEATHPLVRLTPDKSELIRLNEDAGSIIVGNPVHLNVMMDSPRLLILVPRQPGATHFTVLNKSGKVIMQRHAVVASPQDQYIRVRRSCANAGSAECSETSVYYCPDMCHEIAVTEDGTLAPTAQSSMSTGSTPVITSTSPQPDPSTYVPMAPAPAPVDPDDDDEASNESESEEYTEPDDSVATNETSEIGE